MTPAAAARDARPLRRKTVALLGASAAVAVAAALLTARGAPPAGRAGGCEDGLAVDRGGMTIAVRALTCQILRGAGETHVAVELRAPAAARASREPVAMALVIDRSGSMVGAPIRDAKTAALRALDALEADDWFAVVTYSTGAELIAPLARATDANKAAARAAIERIRADGGTNISGGLDRATEALGAPCRGDCPPRDHIRRVVLISDGQANEGVYHRDGLAALAARTAERGTSITSIGVGLDFDERTMTEIAVAGRGNYYFVERSSDLAAIFTRELGSLAETVAVDARLAITPAPGVEVLEAYGYRLDHTGAATVVPIADLRAGETRKVVLRLRVHADRLGARELVATRLTWRATGEHQARAADARVSVVVTDDVAAVDGSRVAAAERHVQEAQLARALDDATEAFERGDTARANQILDERAGAAAAAAAAIGDAELSGKVRATKQAAEQHFKPGADTRRAGKANRGMSYELTR